MSERTRGERGFGPGQDAAWLGGRQAAVFLDLVNE